LQSTKYYHVPNKENLITLADLYGRGNKYDAVTYDKTRAIIWLTVLSSKPYQKPMKHIAKDACLHQDDLLLRFCLQCGAIPLEAFSDSQFNSILLQTLIEYNVKPNQELKDIVDKIQHPNDLVWYYEQIHPEAKDSKSIDACLHELMSANIPPVICDHTILRHYAHLVSILLQLGANVDARFFLHGVFANIFEHLERCVKTSHWSTNPSDVSKHLERIRWAVQDAQNATATRKDRVAQKQQSLVDETGVPKEIAHIILQYSPETVRFHHSYIQ